MRCLVSYYYDSLIGTVVNRSTTQSWPSSFPSSFPLLWAAGPSFANLDEEEPIDLRHVQSPVAASLAVRSWRRVQCTTRYRGVDDPL